jgi:hypothetical protein
MLIKYSTFIVTVFGCRSGLMRMYLTSSILWTQELSDTKIRSQSVFVESSFECFVASKQFLSISQNVTATITLFQGFWLTSLKLQMLFRVWGLVETNATVTTLVLGYGPWDFSKQFIHINLWFGFSKYTVCLFYGQTRGPRPPNFLQADSKLDAQQGWPIFFSEMQYFITFTGNRSASTNYFFLSPTALYLYSFPNPHFL